MPLGLIKCENQPARLSQSFGLPEDDCPLLCLQNQREAAGNLTTFTGLHSWAHCEPALCQKCPQWPDSMIQLLITKTCLKVVYFAVLKALIARKNIIALVHNSAITEYLKCSVLVAKKVQH